MENIITRDDDGHWYLIPLEYKDEFSRLVDDEEYFYSCGGFMPDWALSLDYPEQIIITEYKFA